MDKRISGIVLGIALATIAPAAFAEESRSERAAQILAEAAEQPSLEAALELLKPNLADPETPDPDLVSTICLNMIAAGTCTNAQLLATLERADSGEMVFVRALKRLELLDDRASAQADIIAAAELGLARAEFFLGEMYLSGEFLSPGPDLEQDGEKAQRYLSSAAESGDTDAMFAVGFAMMHGGGIDENHYEGIYWLEQAAAAGVARAQFELAYAYQTGLGVAQNADEAVELFLDAAEQGNALAYYEAARTELGKSHVRRDVTAILRYLESAAEGGVDMALVDLARLHDRGLGHLERDTKKARSYLAMAAKSADPRVVEAARAESGRLGGESIADLIRPPAQSGAEKVGAFFRDLLVTAVILDIATGGGLSGGGDGMALNNKHYAEQDAQIRQWSQDISLDAMSM